METNTTDHSLISYFFELETRGLLRFDRKIGKEYYFRTDTEKFAVSESGYYDHKSGSGGKLIKAIMHFENKTWLDALVYSRRLSPIPLPAINRNRQNIPTTKHDSQALIIEHIKRPSNSRLLDYFNSRGISSDVLREYSKEVHYSTDKGKFFGIGIKNLSGGYDVRNSMMKVKIGLSDISFLVGEINTPLVVVEGMVDAFSILELQKEKGNRNNIVVLNSTVNVEKFIDRYRGYGKRIYTCLDGDEAGNKATARLKNSFLENQVSDIRESYGIKPGGNKDINEYFLRKIEKFNNGNINLEELKSSKKNNENAKNRTRSEITSDIESVGGRPSIQETNGLIEVVESGERDNGGGSSVGGNDVGDGSEASAVSDRRAGEGRTSRTEGGTQGTSVSNTGIAGSFEEESTEDATITKASNVRYAEDIQGGKGLQEGQEEIEGSNSISERGNRNNKNRTLHGERVVSNISVSTNNNRRRIRNKYSNEEIYSLVSELFTVVYPYQRLELKEGLEITEEIRETVSSFKPGGVTKQGRGVLDEYYTDTRITDAVSNLIKNSFSDKGEILVLEPSIGTGNFITSINKLGLKTKITGFEINEVSAGISKVLHPEVEINLRSFEDEFINITGDKTKEKDIKKYDLVIGNPPYGERSSLYKGLGEKSKTNTWQEYFVERGLDSLNDGGILAMILPSGWINRQTNISNVDLLNAFRLPNGVFKGTNVGTDIIILRKNVNNIEQNISKYFERHPEYVLGDQEKRKNQYGREEIYVKGKLKDALLKLEGLSFEREKSIQKKGIVYVQEDLFPNFSFEDGKEQKEILNDEQLKALAEKLEIVLEHLNSVTIKSLRTYNEIEKYTQIKNHITDSPRYFTVENINSLTEEVETRISYFSNKNNNDAEYALRYTPDIKKGVLKYRFIKNDGVVDSSTQNNLNISVEELESFRDTDYDGVLNKTQNHFQYANFYDGKWIHDFYYSEGNIYSKLEQLERDFSGGYINGEQYDKQKNLLDSVLPKPRSLDRIIISPNHEFIHKFSLGIKEIKEYDPSKKEIVESEITYTLAHKFIDFVKSLPSEVFADSSSWEVMSFVNNESVTGSDRERNALIRERRKSVSNDLFSKFIREELSDAEKERFVIDFNRNYNGVHIPDYSKFPLFSNIYEKFKGKRLSLTEVQRSGIGRLTTKGVGLLAHEVGYGKTLSGILSMHEAMERGNSKRPLIVVPNDSILQQWIETIYETIPDAKVNVLGNLGKSYDLSNFNIVDGEITIVTSEGFKNIGFSEKVTKRLASKFSYISNNELKGIKNSEREEQKKLGKLEETRGIMMRGKVYDWEDFGFDHLTFDEVHNANHIVGRVKIEDKRFHSDFRNQTQRTSKLGIDTWMACQYLQEKMNGRNVTLLSATPFTNKPLEYYSILSLIANNRLEDLGFFEINNFFETFMEADMDMEIDAKGEVSFKTNVRRFKNNALLRQLLSEFVDIKGDEENTEIIKPNRVNKEYKIEQNDFTKEQYDILESSLDASKEGAILNHIMNARKISISPYLSPYYEGVKPSTNEFIENSPKLKTTMELIRQNKLDKPEAGQIIYSELAVDEFPKMKEYLIKDVGYNSDEVKIITGKTNKGERLKIQEEFNSGKVKVIIGSSAIQEGMNLQENTTDLYMLSLPYNFTALRQVEGRAWRQGNKWENIRVNYMLTNDSIDVFMLQKLQTKQSRFNEAMKNNVDLIDVSDIKTEELKTALITDPEMRARIEITQLEKRIIQEKNKLLADQAFKQRHFKDYFSLKSNLSYQKSVIETTEDIEFKKNIASRLPETEEKLEKSIKKLASKGLRISDIESQIKFTEQKINDQAEKLAELPKLYQTLILKYKTEKREYKEENFIEERVLENKTFFNISKHYTNDLKEKNDYKESLKDLRKLNVDPPKQKISTPVIEQEHNYKRLIRR